MNKTKFGLAWLLSFLINPVKFGIVEGEGGGNADEGGNNNNDGDNPGSNKDNKGRDWSDNTNQNSGSGDNDGNQDGDNGDSGSDDKFEMDKLTPATQKYIKDLRKENANYRTQSRGNEDELTKFKNDMKSALGMGEEDQVSPEEQVKALTSQSQDLAFTNSVLSLSLENGLGVDQSEYLQFLVQKEYGSLKENEEISEDTLNELVAKAKGSGSSKGKGDGNTSVDDDGNPNPNGDSSVVTVEQFAKMSLVQKTQLKSKNPNLYTKLFSEAAKRRMI